MLPANTELGASLTIYNTAAASYGLTVGLMWFIPGDAAGDGIFRVYVSQFPNQHIKPN